MDIEKRQKDDILIFDISGQIDLYNFPNIRDLIIDNIEENKCNIILNLENVTYIDSSGIGAIVSCLSRLKKNNGSLKILNIKGAVKKLFNITMLDKHFEIFENENNAISSFPKTRACPSD